MLMFDHLLLFYFFKLFDYLLLFDVLLLQLEYLACLRLLVAQGAKIQVRDVAGGSVKNYNLFLGKGVCHEQGCGSGSAFISPLDLDQHSICKSGREKCSNKNRKNARKLALIAFYFKNLKFLNPDPHLKSSWIRIRIKKNC